MLPVLGPDQGWLWVQEEEGRHRFGRFDKEVVVVGSQGSRRGGRGREGGRDGTPGGGKRVGLSEKGLDGVVPGM